MRMRKKPWARPELEACPFYTDKPAEHRGRWAEWFGNEKPIFLELGCGKGGFISKQAVGDAAHNYIAVDIKDAVIGLAKRKVEREYEAAGRAPDNVRLVTLDIERIPLMLEAGKDTISRIYINFCNPWPRPRHNKKRLTHTRQLTAYKQFLAPGAEIWFKTDNDMLFEDSLGYFEETGFTAEYVTRDLHASGFADSTPTEHEAMFSEEGIPIKFVIARLKA